MKKSATLFCFIPLLACLFLAACSSQKTTDATAKTGSSYQADKIWISKLDGSKQCGMEKTDPITPEQASAALKKAGIKVWEAKAGHDGQMRIMVCGAPTGKTVECLIDAANEAKAEKLGFQRRLVGEALAPPAKEEKTY